MKTLSLATIEHDYSQKQAIFFTEDGKIFIDLQKGTPFLSISSMLARCHLQLKHAHDHGEVLVIHVTMQLPPDELIKAGFQLMRPKDYFLTLEDQGEREQLLLSTTHWSVAHTMLQFCSHCAAPLEKIVETTEKKCSCCHRSFFPKLSPAVLVLIQKEDQLLLGRSVMHRLGMYTALAGFIELGESAEAAVHREVQEEVGLKITNLRYFGSQSWPFSDSFMIAFKADYLSGEIKIDPSELEDARWFYRSQLPQLPSHSTLSRKLIESF